MVRQFSIKNNKGQTYDLLDTKKVMFFEPEGLGYEEDTDYLRIGTTFNPLNLSCKQIQIKGDLIFAGRAPYRDYFDFVTFARQAPLVLSYTTFDTFYLKVDIAGLGKTELTKARYLNVPVVFQARGIWYKNESQYIEPITGEMPVYPYVYPDVYPPEALQAVFFNSNAVQESPCKITIYGEAVNPVWRHYVNGKLIETGAYNGTIPVGHTLVVDSTTMPYSITEYDGNGQVVADRYAGCDFSTERFFMLQIGNNEVSVSHSGTDSIALKVEAQYRYESV
ncbi:MAG: phage baseplate protein [Aeriscardovia sp.]|nr:phage baseplate protein [Aeriscardovia sp.]